ncbi:MAG: hypothetical protein A2W91_11710 [Bacteroidetes bacterium GWF2_38_335]|nr:MAG: hypothetical protein A2W91_11710 [Bacteroidetes bacterium GWF2_38_335]OFY77945.1 MAG: hypothetical protein A2281_18455 [Bacteroidetes bacterium RIFOXYA12_FULL_38_20]HBS86686.1 EamA family transporter [Bacteroidales bacterium]
MNSAFKVYLSIILSMSFWGFSFVWSSIALRTLEPFTVVLTRLLISVPLLFVMAVFLKKLQKIDRKDYLSILILAGFQPLLYFIGESYGINESSATVSSVIIATIPLFVPFAAWIFLKEKISLMNFAGIIVSVAGVLVISLEKSFSANLFGILMLFLAVAAAVGYSIRVKKLTEKYNPLTLISYQNLTGIFLFLPFFLITDLNTVNVTDYTSDTITSLLLLSVFASSAAFVLFIYSIKHLGVIKTGAFSNAIPVMTAIIAWIVLDEELTIQKSIGILIVISGLFLSQVKFRKNGI